MRRGGHRAALGLPAAVLVALLAALAGGCAGAERAGPTARVAADGPGAPSEEPAGPAAEPAGATGREPPPAPEVALEPPAEPAPEPLSEADADQGPAPDPMAEPADEAAPDPGGAMAGPAPEEPRGRPEYEAPAVIDTAYAALVLETLDATHGQAARLAAEERTLSSTFIRHLAAVYEADELNRAVLPGWLDQANRDFPDLREDPGDPVTTVRAVTRADPGCVVVEAVRDYNAFYRVPQEPQVAQVALVPAPPGLDDALNPTPYVIAHDDAPVEDPCA